MPAQAYQMYRPALLPAVPAVQTTDSSTSPVICRPVIGTIGIPVAMHQDLCNDLIDAQARDKWRSLVFRPALRTAQRDRNWRCTILYFVIFQVTSSTNSKCEYKYWRAPGASWPAYMRGTNADSGAKGKGKDSGIGNRVEVYEEQEGMEVTATMAATKFSGETDAAMKLSAVKKFVASSAGNTLAELRSVTNHVEEAFPPGLRDHFEMPSLRVKPPRPFIYRDKDSSQYRMEPIIALNGFPGTGRIVQEGYAMTIEDPISPCPEDALNALLDAAIEHFGYAARDVFHAIYFFDSMSEDDKQAFQISHQALEETIAVVAPGNRVVNSRASHRMLIMHPIPCGYLEADNWTLNLKSDWIGRRMLKQLHISGDIDIWKTMNMFR
ncbi:hypothetical protein BU17DRAFT_97876 [Hysterangium stoloniferum]|nr:hypothetical protein BU17DRAFT_97876 [Hysterangium stoloniferum]